MKILAIDIGAGTQDILLFDSGKKIENCISLVLPTPSKVLAERLKTIEGDVYIHGDTIGGGSLARAVSRHLRKGFRVVMEEGAAIPSVTTRTKCGPWESRSASGPNSDGSWN